MLASVLLVSLSFTGAVVLSVVVVVGVVVDVVGAVVLEVSEILPGGGHCRNGVTNAGGVDWPRGVLPETGSTLEWYVGGANVADLVVVEQFTGVVLITGVSLLYLSVVIWVCAGCGDM